MASILEVLRTLEVELHHPGVSCSRSRLEELLHPAFHEVGRSGRKYDRRTVIDFLLSQQSHAPVVAKEFTAQELAPGVVLLTYHSAQEDGRGGFCNQTHRSSLWLLHGEVWSMRYHQGTPAAGC